MMTGRTRAVRRIICIGNRYVAEDSAGYRVHQRLLGRCPRGVALIDGGLQGLNLLPLFDGALRVVLVDNIQADLAPDSDVVVLDGAQVAALADGEMGYGHAAGLPYLLRALPAVCDPVPPIVLVGIRNNNETALDTAASLALELALDGGDRSERWADGAAGEA